MKNCRSDDLEWKEIPGYGGRYEASYYGEIRKVYGWPPKEGVEIKYKILKPYLAKRKRGDKFEAKVGLEKNGKRETRYIARLVAMTWCEGYKKGLTVDHFDGNTLNNRADNLEWVTLKENIRRAANSNYTNMGTPCKLIKGNGDTYSFCSLKEASKFLHRSDEYVRICLLREKLPTDKKGVVYMVEM